MQVSTEISRADLLWTNLLSLRDPRLWGRFALMVLALLAAFLAIGYPQSLEAGRLHTILVPVLTIFPTLLLIVLVAPALTASAATGMIGPRSYEIGKKGIRVRTANSEVFIGWRQIAAMRRTRRHLLAEVGPHNFLIIPRRSFASPEEADAFYARAAALQAAAQPRVR